MKREIQKLPDSPGIYKFIGAENNLLYVGKSVSIKKRVSSYFTSKNLGPKISLLVKKIDHVEYIKVFSEFEALLLEAELIRTNQPFFNSSAKDDKSPIYIKITSGEIPLIQLVRKPEPKKGEFIKGPFPSAKETGEILRMARGIFGYCHHKNPQKACLYVHLGLCPYPLKDERSKIEYQKTIRKIKDLLSGRSKQLVNSLAREMKKASRNQKYEEAGNIKKQIEKLQYISTVYRTPREFLEQPTLVDDHSTAKLKDLKNKLELEKLPKRIECYDISNISGKHATGSMVVFTNGKSDKNQYRLFKIKFYNTPNDYEMLKEVLARRLNNDWPRPDLILIDGGRGQLNTALSVLRKYDPSIPAATLAKRLEEIYVPTKILPISLPKESPARQLAQEIRDEAHRFAITYHRLLRSKNLLKAS